MALHLLLLFGACWVQVASPDSLQRTTMLPSTPHITAPSTSEAQNASPSVSVGSGTVDSKETISPWGQTTIPVSLTPLETTELSSLETSAGASMSTPVPEPTASQEVSSKTSALLPEPSNVASDPPVTAANPVTDGPAANPVTDGTAASTSISKGTSAPPTTVTTSSNETSGPSVATTVSSKTSGPPVTTATGSLGPSSEMHGLPATTATSSVESSSVARGTSVSSRKTSTTSTQDPITTRSPSQESSGMLLVPMLIALVVVLALVALLLLWRQRQKRRTGALTLSGGGKRNGVVDAWAGPARVPDEEATSKVFQAVRCMEEDKEMG